MRYGFIVHASDSSGAKYKYFAQYASSIEEAQEAFHIETISKNESDLIVTNIVPATQFEWEHFDWHGDCYNPPNSKHGMPKRKPNNNQNQNSKPNVFKKSNRYKVKFK